MLACAADHRDQDILGALHHVHGCIQACGAEMLLPIWVRLWGALGTPMFNFKIAR